MNAAASEYGKIISMRLIQAIEIAECAVKELEKIRDMANTK